MMLIEFDPWGNPAGLPLWRAELVAQPRKNPSDPRQSHWQVANLKLPIQVLQLKVPSAFKYSVV